MGYWITSHWPIPDLSWDRHVYIKDQTTIPQPGDTVFVYETKYATVNDKRVKTVRRVHGKKYGPEKELPVGYGGIIGVMTATADSRRIGPDDVVYDYGNLSLWSIVPCRYFREARLPHADLLAFLGMDPKTPATPFRLCQIDENRAGKLLAHFGLEA